MEKITYTNSLGEAITFDGPPFYLQSIAGLGDVTANLQLQKSAYQNGSRLVGTQLDEREINVSFVIATDDDEHEYGELSNKRIQLARVLNPLLGKGTLRYENEGFIREIDCVADSVPIYPDSGKRSKRLQAGSVMFVAPDPFWKSTERQEEPMFTPMFEFPFEGDFQFGLQMDERVIRNGGDAPSPVRIEMQGPAFNPTITNKTTNKYIKINRELREGETLVVNTHPEALTVEFIGIDGTVTDVMQWLDFGSSLSSFRLECGYNTITYSADNELHHANINLIWQRLYNAV